VSRGIRFRLRDERGQSLVFVILLLFSLVAVFALVVDVGSWIRAQRHAQVVADAAALAGIQELPSGAANAQTVAANYANLNWPGVNVTVNPSGSSIEVDVEHDAPGLFSRLVGLINVNVGAQATARVEVPIELNAIAPLALECRDFACSPWNVGAQDTFTYDTRDISGSSLGPVDLPGVNTGNFSTYVSCDPYTPNSGNCNQTVAAALNDHPRLSRSARQVRIAIQNAGSSPHIVAIFDDYSSGEYEVVGWAVADLQVENWGRRWVRIRATFRDLLVKSSWLSDDGAGNNTNYDFGVRTVGLTR
jgi:Flp pilus assembly protein TadG